MFGFGPILTLVDSISGGGGFVPYSPRYLGSNVTVTGSVTIPTGATSLTITLENAGGGGAKSFSYGSAYGGSGGARCVKTIAIDPADAAKVINYSLGAKGIYRKGSVGNGTDPGACSVSAPVALVVAPSQWRRRRQAGQADRHRGAVHRIGRNGDERRGRRHHQGRQFRVGRAWWNDAPPGRSAAGRVPGWRAPTAATPIRWDRFQHVLGRSGRRRCARHVRLHMTFALALAAVLAVACIALLIALD